jgi:hypothetical protein
MNKRLGIAQAVEYMPSMHKVLGSIPNNEEKNEYILPFQSDLSCYDTI